MVGAYVLTQRNTIRGKLFILGRILVPYSLGFFAVFVPVAVGYLIYAPLADFLFDIVSYPSEYYARMRSLPFPTWRALVESPDKIAIYLPTAIWAAVLVILLRGKASGATGSLKHKKTSSPHWVMILFCALSMVFLSQGLCSGQRSPYGAVNYSSTCAFSDGCKT